MKKAMNQMRGTRHVGRPIGVLFLFVLAGCGGQKTSSVTGTVTLDGKPLAGAATQFVPQGTGRDATCGTDASGRFSMSTFQPGDGVVAGTYKVVIAPPLGVADTTKYATSEDAMSGASKVAAKKGTGPKFPQKYTRPDQTPLTQEVPPKGVVKIELKSE